MVDLSKVSQKIMEQVDAIKQMSGNSRKIDTPAEYESLSKLLAGEAGAGNKEYIQGFMIEYENKYPTLEKLLHLSACAIKDCFVPTLKLRHNGGIVVFRALLVLCYHKPTPALHTGSRISISETIQHISN